MRTLTLLILAAVSLLAQADNWMLLRGIYPGQLTHVHMLDGSLQSGGFISTSDANIVIRQRTGDQTFTKEQIRKVSVRKASMRWRNAGRGAGTAAVIGGVLGGIAGRSEGNIGGFAAAGAFILAPYGLVIGALFPGYDTLYRLPRK